MLEGDTVNQPTTDEAHDGQWTREEAEQHMRQFVASLASPPSLEDLARAQGIRIPQRIEDLAGGFTEEDFEGFDAFIEQLRNGDLDLERWKQRPKPGRT